MYRSYTKIFRIFGCVNKFLQNCKIAALFKNQKITKAHCCSSSASLTAWARCQRHNEDARWRGQFRPAKRAGGESPVRWTAPT